MRANRSTRSAGLAVAGLVSAVGCLVIAGMPAMASSSVRPATKPAGTTTTVSLPSPDGRTRAYHLYVPRSAGRTGTDRLPLLIALHGGLGSGTQFETQTGFDGLAEANRFIVAYPDGVGVGPRGSIARTWNGGRCCGPAVRQGVDDVTFVRMIIDQVSSRYPIDPARVFAAGHSNGGILAYRLACELSDRISAVGVQSASLEVSTCESSQPVSLIHIHGTADRNLPITGGKGPEGLSGVAFNPPRDGVKSLAAANGCSAKATIRTSHTNADVTVERFGSCPPGVAVEFVTVAGAPHAWMGHPAVRPGVKPYPRLDASAVIWSFLAAHPKVPPANL